MLIFLEINFLFSYLQNKYTHYQPNEKNILFFSQKRLLIQKKLLLLQSQLRTTEVV